MSLSNNLLWWWRWERNKIDQIQSFLDMIHACVQWEERNIVAPVHYTGGERTDKCDGGTMEPRKVSVGQVWQRAVRQQIAICHQSDRDSNLWRFGDRYFVHLTTSVRGKPKEINNSTNHDFRFSSISSDLSVVFQGIKLTTQSSTISFKMEKNRKTEKHNNVWFHHIYVYITERQ